MTSSRRCRLLLLLAVFLTSGEPTAFARQMCCPDAKNRPVGVTIRYTDISLYEPYMSVSFAVTNDTGEPLNYLGYSPDMGLMSTEVAYSGVWRDPSQGRRPEPGPAMGTFSLQPGATQKMSLLISNDLRGCILRTVLFEAYPDHRRFYSEPFQVDASAPVKSGGKRRQADPAHFYCLVVDALGAPIPDARIEFLTPMPDGARIGAAVAPYFVVDIVSPFDVPAFAIRVNAANFTPFASGPLRLSASDPQGLIVVLKVPSYTRTATSARATVEGTVQDPQGAVIPGARVWLVASGTGSKPGAPRVETTTDMSGNYVLRDLGPGTYDVRAAATGFRSAVRRGLVVSADSSARADVTLYVMMPRCESHAPCAGARSPKDDDEIARRFFSGLREDDLRRKGLDPRKPENRSAIARARTLVVSDRLPSWLAERVPSGFKVFDTKALRKQGKPGEVVRFYSVSDVVDESCCFSIAAGWAELRLLPPDPNAAPDVPDWSGFVFRVDRVGDDWLTPDE